VLLLSLAGVLGLAAPAAASVDNGALRIWGQQGPNGGYLQLNAEFSDGYEGTQPMEDGTGFTLAFQREGAEEPDLWGALSPPQRWFPVVSGEQVSGTGVATDPIVGRKTMRAPGAEIAEELITLKDSAGFVARWTVRNTGGAPLNFRATAFANYGDLDNQPHQVSRALVEPGALRRLGSEVPEGGLPAEYLPPGGNTSGAHGRGGLLEELPASPWSHAELGQAEEMRERVLADLPMRDRYASGYLDAAAVAQWDRHVLGTPGLAPGASTSFEVRFVRFNSLWHEWTGPTGPDCTAGVRFVTAYGRGGPRRDATIVFRHGDGLTERETLRTDAAGEARATLPRIYDTPFPAQQWGGFEAWLETDGDRVLDADEPGRVAPLMSFGARPCPPVAQPVAVARRRGAPALRLMTATRRGRRVVVRGRIARAATGRVRLAWTGRRRAHSARRSVRLRPRAGRIARTIVLSRRAASARRQRVTLSYAGSSAFAPAKVSLRVRR
jgi:hypothetical protein